MPILFVDHQYHLLVTGWMNTRDNRSPCPRMSDASRGGGRADELYAPPGQGSAAAGVDRMRDTSLIPRARHVSSAEDTTRGRTA
jgi:hypothetical protein